MTVGLLLLLAGLVLLSGLFSGTEIALFSVPPARARALADEGRHGAAAMHALKSNPERLLVTILIGNNVVNIAAASVATWAATQAFGSAGVGIATGVMTLAVLFFGEIIPKTFAATHAVRVSLIVSPFFLWLSRLLLPVALPLEALSRLLLPKDVPVPGVTPSEIQSLARLGHQAGSIEEHERQLVERAFALDRMRAWEVMTPRVEIFAWPARRPLVDIAPELHEVPYSRIPVYGDSLDEITGILHVREAYESLISGQRDVQIGELAREPFFVPHSVSLVHLLGEFQARRIHMGVVVDEHGGTDGIITLEDVLEELVGEIADELDVPEESIARVGRHEILVDGGTDLKEVNHFFNTRFPVLEHRTVNGFLLDAFGRVPGDGERLDTGDVRLEVVEASETQVLCVRITRLAPPVRSPAGQEDPGAPDGATTDGTARDGPAPDGAGGGKAQAGGRNSDR
ncbi:MAG: hemolysin family protein [Gemmatimonadota bacterium]|nr:hemolysin family protein [Gemmatimonadota bacterium]